jgi:hypothetical protein
MRERDMLWPGFVISAVLMTTFILGVMMLSNRVLVTEWRDVSVPHQSETLRVPSRVEHAGVEYDCTLVGSRRSVPVASDHVHDWSRTLDGIPVSGADCLDCGEVAK